MERVTVIRMTGILNKTKKRVAVLLIAVFCMMLFMPAVQATAYTITFSTPVSGLYEFLDENEQQFAGDTLQWDTTPTSASPSGDGPFKFSVSYDRTRFAGIDVTSQAASNQPVTLDNNNNLTASSSYPLYTINSLASNITVRAAPYSKITFTNSTFPQMRCDFVVDPQYNQDKVPYDSSFVFKIVTDAFCLPVVYDEITNTPIDYTSVQPNPIVGSITEYTFIYELDSVKQNMNINVRDVIDAYLVQLPDVDTEKATSTPPGGFYVIDINEDFEWLLEFTAKWGPSLPHASVNDTTVSLTYTDLGANQLGAKAYRIKIGRPLTSKNIAVTYATEEWSLGLKSVEIQLSPNEYAYSIIPSSGFLQVVYDETAEFTLVPTAAFAHNTVTPGLTVSSGQAASAVHQADGSWKCTIAGVKTNLLVNVNISQWTMDPNAPSGTTSIITMPAGTGYSIGNVLGGMGVGNNQYRVNNGADFSFSVNVSSGYDASTLAVNVNGQRIFPVSGVYTIPSVNSNLTVSITVSADGASSTTSPGTTGATSTPVDDGTLKYHEVYDEATGVMVSGFFVGKPEFIVTELVKSDPVYVRMFNSSGATEESKVLRAVDIQITKGVLYGSLSVGLFVGPGYNTIEMRVVHGTPQGDELFDVVGYNGLATVNVRSTSPFMVVDSYGIGPGTVDTNGTGGSSGTNGMTITPPRTGGANNIFGFILLGIVAGCVVGIIVYRNKGKG